MSSPLLTCHIKATPGKAQAEYEDLVVCDRYGGTIGLNEQLHTEPFKMAPRYSAQAELIY
jgi:hypothetical protein